MKEQTLVDFMHGTNDDNLVSQEQVDKLIAEHEESILSHERLTMNNQDEIARCKDRIKELKAKRKTLNDDKTITQVIADILHKGCMRVHDKTSWLDPDASSSRNCSYEDTGWIGFTENPARVIYHTKAESIVNIIIELDIPLNDALRLIQATKEST